MGFRQHAGRNTIHYFTGSRRKTGAAIGENLLLPLGHCIFAQNRNVWGSSCDTLAHAWHDPMKKVIRHVNFLLVKSAAAAFRISNATQGRACRRCANPINYFWFACAKRAACGRAHTSTSSNRGPRALLWVCVRRARITNLTCFATTTSTAAQIVAQRRGRERKKKRCERALRTL